MGTNIEMRNRLGELEPVLWFNELGRPVFETDMAQLLGAQAVWQAKAKHQAWHQETGETACPWGCGDGSGTVGP